jgi:TRAP-type C4-dicarboxylate transport system permease small subunit
MLTKASRALDKTEDILAGISGVLLLFTTFIVTMEVFSRFFFNHSFIWINEITEYILLYIPFFAGAWLLRTDGHIVVDMIDLVASRRFLQGTGFLVSLIGLFVSFVIVYYGIITLIDLYERDVRSITVLKIPQTYVYISIPLGALVMGLEFVRKIYQSISPIKEELT